MTSEIADLRKQVLELTEALRLTIISKEDALARAAAENQKLRDADRATKAEEGLREAIEALEPFTKVADDYDAADMRQNRQLHSDGHRVSVSIGECRAVRAALARIKELLPP